MWGTLSGRNRDGGWKGVNQITSCDLLSIMTALGIINATTAAIHHALIHEELLRHYGLRFYGRDILCPLWLVLCRVVVCTSYVWSAFLLKKYKIRICTVRYDVLLVYPTKRYRAAVRYLTRLITVILALIYDRWQYTILLSVIQDTSHIVLYFLR